MNTKPIKGFYPAETRVLVELIPDTTPSGFITSVEKRKDRGIVVGRGAGCTQPHSALGNDILFNVYNVKEITIGGRSVIMINEDQIYGTFTKIK